MNMFKPAQAASVEEYLTHLSVPQREVIESVHEFIQKTAPELTPWFAYNMLGYGRFPCRNYKKELIDWPLIALAQQKNYVSLYVCALDGKEYVAEKFKEELGNVSVGKSCIRFKKIADLNFATLEKVIKTAVKTPGLGKKD